MTGLKFQTLTWPKLQRIMEYALCEISDINLQNFIDETTRSSEISGVMRQWNQFLNLWNFQQTVMSSLLTSSTIFQCPWRGRHFCKGDPCGTLFSGLPSRDWRHGLSSDFIPTLLFFLLLKIQKLPDGLFHG